jgi:transposase
LVRIRVGADAGNVLPQLFQPPPGAAYSGLAPAPWQSGGINRDQGISKAGNPRLRRMMIEAAWTWLRY